MLSALIFDVDGTLADTEGAHREAFNAAFIDAGLDWCWSESVYTDLLNVAGGKERMLHYWNKVDPVRAGGSKARQTINTVHALKTRHYETIVSGGRLPLRPGMLRLIREAHAARMPMAIATTTTPANIDVLLRTPLGSDWRTLFITVCDASTVPNKKPAPDVYLAALDVLALPAADCLAFEDSENGLRAARAAGIPALITPTAYTARHQFDDALLVLQHLGDPEQPMAQHIPGAGQRWADLAALRCWHDGMLFEAV